MRVIGTARTVAIPPRRGLAVVVGVALTIHSHRIRAVGVAVAIYTPCTKLKRFSQGGCFSALVPSVIGSRCRGVIASLLQVVRRSVVIGG